MRRLLCTAVSVALSSVANPAPAWAADSSPTAGQSLTSLPPLLKNIGHAEWQIDTQSTLAQQYFNQGVRLLYGFNFEQAVDAFRAANIHDGGGCAICFWGEGYAVGKSSHVAGDVARRTLLLEPYAYVKCGVWLGVWRTIGRNLNAGMDHGRIPAANGATACTGVPRTP